MATFSPGTVSGGTPALIFLWRARGDAMNHPRLKCAIPKLVIMQFKTIGSILEKNA